MSTIERSIAVLEQVGDHANPILVKETRQSLKSRQFVVTFMLLLAASWFIFTMGIMLGGDAIEFGAIGNEFFWFFYVILAFAVLVLVPFGAYRSLLAEKDQATYDLLSITTLSPRQIVWGKLSSALVQVLIFYSAIAPFIAFTSLLQGFDFLMVAFMLIVTLLMAMLSSIIAIASSAMTKQRQYQGLTSLFVLGALVIQTLVLLSIVGRFVNSFSLVDAEAWWTLAFGVVIAGSYFLLFQKVATAHLTFESDDRISGIRMVFSGQFFLLWIGIFVMTWLAPLTFSINDELVLPAIVVSYVHWGLVGLFAVTEDPYLSRRIRRDLPKGRLRRLLFAPFLQGGNRGFVYVLFHLAILTGISFMLVPMLGSGTWSLDVPIAMTCYLVIILGMACALARWCLLLSSDIRAGHVRVLTLIIVAIASMLPFVPMLWTPAYRFTFNLTMILNPIATLIHLANDGHQATAVIPVLCIGAVVAILVNLRAMRAGLNVILRSDVKPRSLVVIDDVTIWEEEREAQTAELEGRE
ncbi:MAG: hypothetical protein KDA93_08990 [Planctomycetaceae bacterium]|nr:hypothetical protein [Planctomycetaceae bacterium]